MKEQRDTSSAEPVLENVRRKKRTKKQPLCHRIIFDDRMVAVVRLLGHEGMLHSEAPDKFQPLIEKFGRERLREVTDEIVEIVGDGDAAVAQLTEQARKLAIQLIGRPKDSNAAETAGTVSSTPPIISTETKATAKTADSAPTRTTVEPVPNAAVRSSSVAPKNAAAETITTASTPAIEKTADSTPEWTNDETSCIAAFLHGDCDFVGECLHLAKMCCERAAQEKSVTSGRQAEARVRTELLAVQLERLVREHDPLAEGNITPFSELMDIALGHVDWQQLAESFLTRDSDESSSS